MGVSNSSKNSQPIKKSGGALPVQPKPLLLLTAGQTVVNAVKPAIQAVTTSTQAVANKVVDLHQKTHPSRRWIFWLIAVLIVLGLGAGAYWVFVGHKHAKPTQTALPPTPFLRTSDIVIRHSALPAGTISRSGNTLVPHLENILPANPGYALLLGLQHVQDDGTVDASSNLTRFMYEPTGGLVSADTGEAIDGFKNDNLSDFNRVQVLLSPDDPNEKSGVLLTGKLPSSGQSVTLDFPFDISKITGRVVASYSDTLKKYSIGLQLTDLPPVAPQGWKYTAWLVEMDGPYVKAAKNLGSIFPGTNGKADHDFSSADSLGRFNTVVVSLEGADDGDQTINSVRLLSASVDLR